MEAVSCCFDVHWLLQGFEGLGFEVLTRLVRWLLQEFEGNADSAAEVGRWSVARAIALAEMTSDRVQWLQAQGPARSDSQRLTLAEAEAEEVRAPKTPRARNRKNLRIVRP